MAKGGVEAFSDGVITIMVLKLRAPHSDSVEALRPLVPVFLSYVLSVVYVGIYWNNHHHILHTVSVRHQVDDGREPFCPVMALRSLRIADAVFVAVALLWLIPDRRIEARLAK